jgi:2-hydroxy-6-oxo-6-(2'-carboxyphenyl)-hexa-2,4-dienoate hydrolase
MTESDQRADVNEDGSIAGLNAQFVDVDGIRTRYYDYGDGEPIVLCHGGNWGGPSSANTWATNIPGLAEHFRILAADRIACGLTDNPKREEDYVYQTEVDHMHDFIRKMGVDEYHLVGQSRGGGLAGHLAVQHPDEVTTLTIVNSETISPRWGDFPHRQRIVMGNIEHGGRFVVEDREQYRQLHEALSYNTDHITDEQLDASMYMKDQPKAQKTARVMSEGGQEQWNASLKESRTETHRLIREGRLGDLPILLIWGRNDQWAVLEQGQALYELLSQSNPNVRLYVVNKAGHHPYQEDPEEFNHTVACWADRWRA